LLDVTDHRIGDAEFLCDVSAIARVAIDGDDLFLGKAGGLPSLPLGARRKRRKNEVVHEERTM
jgi:hypothetical protein